MNIKLLTKDNYRIFINKHFFKELDMSEKEQIVDFVKTVILQKRKSLNLRGFYKVLVYLNKKVGMFIELSKLEDSSYFNNLDLRVIVNNDSEIYFETEDYFLIQNCKDVRFFNGNFYALLNDDIDNILKIIEFGRLIYGEDVINLLANGIVL